MKINKEERYAVYSKDLGLNEDSINWIYRGSVFAKTGKEAIEMIKEKEDVDKSNKQIEFFNLAWKAEKVKNQTYRF